MIDQRAFEQIRQTLEKEDEMREVLIKKSRDILKLSKKAIYAFHRDDSEGAESLLSQAQSAIAEVSPMVCAHQSMLFVGAYNEALEEYVEARCYQSFLNGQALPTPAQLKVQPDVYLLGVCDLTGELLRKAINSATKGDVAIAFKIKDFVTELYGQLMLFDFRNSLLRRKFDRIKYVMEKLEDLGLQLTLKGQKA